MKDDLIYIGSVLVFGTLVGLCFIWIAGGFR